MLTRNWQILTFQLCVKEFISDPETERQFQSISDLLVRVEASVKKKGRGEKAINWITLAATIVSTIVIASLTAFTTYRLGEQTRILQAAVAVQKKIVNGESPK